LAAWKTGRWNTLRIRCVGKYPRITTWINYTKIAEFDAATTPHPRYDREQMFQTLGREGAIALQIHNGTGAWRKGAKCRWKNIRVRSL
ncbi:family 16 glycoside hydrolase, partial [Fodinibius roseus]|uniref:family 16 glycoside hydrolase n=1 Tax=Fodinibius roseus TaxID=1194090 RepID=UPI00147BC2D4